MLEYPTLFAISENGMDLPCKSSRAFFIRILRSIFEKLKELTGTDEAFKTFNMGVGFCLVVSSKNVKKVLEDAADYEPFVFGEVV